MYVSGLRGSPPPQKRAAGVSTSRALPLRMVTALRVVKGPIGRSVTLQPGASFGEASLCLNGATDVRREASVYAIEDCSLMQINAHDLDGIGVDIAAVKSHLVTLMLSKVSFFKSLPRGVLEQMGAIMDIAYVPTGELIFEEGDPGTEMYILVDGAVQMHKKQIELQRRERDVCRSVWIPYDDATKKAKGAAS